MKPKISMITLGVTDLERSTIFYRDGLGLPADTQFEGVVFFRLQGAWLSLFPLEDLDKDSNVPTRLTTSQPFGSFTLAHNVASKEEVVQVFKQAIAAGAIPLKEPQEAVWGGYHAHFADPDNFIWEVAWNSDFDLT